MTEVNNGTRQNTDEISLKSLISLIRTWWKYLLTQWVSILIAVVTGGVVGVIYSYFNKPIYKAELSFALQDESSGGGLSGAMSLANQFGFDLGNMSAGGEFSGDNLLELMKSRNIIEKSLLTPVVANGKVQTLAELYIYLNDFRENWKDRPELRNIYFLPGADRSKFSLKQDSLLGAFYKSIIKNNLDVDKIDSKLSIISINVNSYNELFSKYFAETLAKTVSDFYIQTKTKKEAQNVALLKKQTDSVRKVLNLALSGVASSIDANPNPNSLLQTLHVPSQRKQVDVQANTSILVELVKNLEMSRMSLLRETPLIQIIDKPILPLEKQKVGKIKGVLIGAFLFGFISFLVFSFKYVINEVMKNEL